jgi:ornithine cyclodeaminase/alanine dehydrogenase-like protein (mu-crystallin family)
MRNVKAPAAPGGRFTGLVLLFSTSTGEPLCILPDGVIQLIRVGATSGLGIKYMARKDARTIGIIGTGKQAAGHLRAACAVRNIDRVRCWSPKAESRARFASQMSAALGIAVEPTESAEAAVKGADIAMCATNSYGPVFFAPWVETGMHLNSIKTPEIEYEAVAKADHVACHSRVVSSLVFETADAPSPKSALHADKSTRPKVDYKSLPTLPELIAGKAVGRGNADDVTCFLNNMGIGFQFAVAGWMAYSKAKERGMGRDLPTEWFTEDVQA